MKGILYLQIKYHQYQPFYIMCIKYNMHPMDPSWAIKPTRFHRIASPGTRKSMLSSSRYMWMNEPPNFWWFFPPARIGVKSSEILWMNPFKNHPIWKNRFRNDDTEHPYIQYSSSIVRVWFRCPNASSACYVSLPFSEGEKGSLEHNLGSWSRGCIFGNPHSITMRVRVDSGNG